MSRTLPDLIDALVDANFDFEGRPENVIDGPPTDLVSGDYLMIGLDQEDAVSGPRSAGQSSTDWAGPNRDMDATGSVSCAIWVASTDGTFKTARDDAYTIHAGLAAAITARNTGDPDIFGIPGLWELHVTGVSELNQARTDAGPEVALRFQITYQAREESQ